ncbi:snare-like protein [Rozella allomycis CSF55]|uniref:Longin domain-containing protein n=1 Tax=Rozella allomycis (strain CSF55) TaxID=988480 RepID=A0A075AVL9_ROZAC|nr:Longin domain-containing protein [Rozella allomycis CSF55]RKP21002.1 snare-like protein [Rozella allomycis CSF55]|eukprot:EPZ34175.1 Longin domain-containing protein [Rozella allomycis CSF55]
MKILAISIIDKTAVPNKLVCGEYDLSSFSFFQRSSVQEFLKFFSCTLSERTQPAVRQSVQEEGHVYSHPSSPLSCVIICDTEYPARVAFSLINKILDDYITKFGQKIETSFPELKEYIAKYQRPENADSILKVQKELDETKVILHKTIESVLERGEKLDHLVAQSEQLSSQSKQFYKVAKKTNSSCCWVQ